MKRILNTLSQKWPEYLLEILVITIGILGAFALNNWNEKTNNSEKEQLILVELNREFRENKKQLIEIEKAHRISYERTKKIIAQFPIELSTVNLDSLSLNIGNMHGTYSFNPSQGTINSLISSSSFELVSNRELRSLLVSWKDVYQDYHEAEIFANKSQLHNIFPYYNKHFQWDVNLRDPRFDLEMLRTFEFENQVNQRNNDLWSILENDEKELEGLKNHIDRIIQLTSTK